jgi:hypothetical protein
MTEGRRCAGIRTRPQTQPARGNRALRAVQPATAHELAARRWRARGRRARPDSGSYFQLGEDEHAIARCFDGDSAISPRSRRSAPPRTPVLGRRASGRVRNPARSRRDSGSGVWHDRTTGGRHCRPNPIRLWRAPGTEAETAMGVRRSLRVPQPTRSHPPGSSARSLGRSRGRSLGRSGGRSARCRGGPPLPRRAPIRPARRAIQVDCRSGHRHGRDRK